MITPELLAKPGKESDHQKALFSWAADNRYRYPELEFMFAIPNGGLRSKITAARMKAEGVRKGVPDVMLPVQNKYPGLGKFYLGLFIEMKIKGNKESEDQVKWRTFLVAQGYECVVCYSWIEAVSAIERYLKG